MIVTDKFVYIHTSRHAGSFINRFLIELVPGAKPVRYHGQLADLPDEYKHLPVIGIIRNPWDWYVSMYFDYKAKQQYIFQIVSEAGTLSFLETIERFVKLGNGSDISLYLLDKIQRAAPKSYTQQAHPKLLRPGFLNTHFINYPLNRGYYSWLIERMHGVNGELIGSFGRFENLRDDLIALMEETNTPITSAMNTYIKQTQPVNKSSRENNYQSYYDKSLIELITEQDNFVINKFSYQF